MYLFHGTTEKYLKKILKDGELKSSALTGFVMEGSGVYKTNPYVYFSTTPKLFDKKVLGKVIIYLKSELVYDKIFFVSTFHNPCPNITGQWKSHNNIEYKRKYKKNYKKYNDVLLKLYNSSISKLPHGRAFQVFNQVAIKNRVKIHKYLAGIQLFNPNIKLVKYIKKYYPDVRILENKV